MRLSKSFTGAMVALEDFVQDFIDINCEDKDTRLEFVEFLDRLKLAAATGGRVAKPKFRNAKFMRVIWRTAANVDCVWNRENNPRGCALGKSNDDVDVLFNPDSALEFYDRFSGEVREQVLSDLIATR